MLWFQVVLQTSLGFVCFPTMGAIQQQLLQLRLFLPTLLHVVHIAHDAGEGSSAALGNKRYLWVFYGFKTDQTAMWSTPHFFRAFQFAESLQDFTQFVFDGAVVKALGVISWWLSRLEKLMSGFWHCRYYSTRINNTCCTWCTHYKGLNQTSKTAADETKTSINAIFWATEQ